MKYVYIRTPYVDTDDSWWYYIDEYDDYEGSEYVGVLARRWGFIDAEEAWESARDYLDGEYGEYWQQI